MAPRGKPGGKGDDEEEDLFLPLREVVTRLQQGPMNFATFQTGDKDKPVVLAAHKRRNPEALAKLARKQAGTPKGCHGTLMLEDGGMLTFQCATEDAPSTIGKRIRVMLRNEGFAKFKVRVLLPGGVELGETDEEGEGGGEGQGGAAPADAAPPGGEPDPLAALRAEVQAAYDALSRPIDAAGLDPGQMRRIEAMRAMFGTVIGPDPRKAQGILQLLARTAEAAGIGQDAAPAAAASTGPASRASALAELEKGIDALLAAYG